MSKLTVMKYNQIVMGLLDINPHTFASPALNWLQVLSPFLIASSMIICILLAALYAYQETHLTLMLEAVGLVIGGPASLSAYLNSNWKKNSVGQVNSRMQEIVDEAMDEKIMAHIYWTTERKCYRFTKQMLAFVVTALSAYIFALFNSIYWICVGNFDTSTYYLPLRLAPPFNIDSLFAWYLFWALQTMIGIAYMCGTVVVTMYFVCCCFYLEALCDHFDRLIESIDAELQENPNSLNGRKILINAIDHHNKIYEIFDIVKDINSGTIFAFLVMCAPYLGIAFHNFEHTDAGLSLEGAATIMFSIVLICCGLLWSFLLCHYGNFATERIRSLDQTVFNANWLDYPPDLRKHIILIIAQSQSNINFNGFNMLSCNLEIFGKICNSASSYYLIFRRFSQR